MATRRRVQILLIWTASFASWGACDDGGKSGSGGIGGSGGSVQSQGGMLGSGGSGVGGIGAMGGSGGMGGGSQQPAGLSFDSGGVQSDVAATATLDDGAAAIVEIKGMAPGRFLISIVKTAAPFTTGDYTCTDAVTISYFTQGTQYMARQEKGECLVKVTSFAGAGKPIAGTFSAKLVNAAGEGKLLKDGTFRVSVEAKAR